MPTPDGPPAIHATAPTERSAPLPGADPPLAPTIRFLRWLTGLLAATMIVGLITIVALFVTRWPVPGGSSGVPVASLPAGLVPATGLVLPEGVTVQALTLGPGWGLVVTSTGEALAFDPATGRVLNRMEVGR